MEKPVRTSTAPNGLCPDEEIDLIRKRLRQLEAEQSGLRSRLAALEESEPSSTEHGSPASPITIDSTVSEKVALFRSFFAGREDVFPKRWENTRSGRSGYAPACSHEWEPHVCGKPRIKCGDCPNQAFIPVTAETVDGHLRGCHTMGLYPLMPDDTCRLLAVDFDKATWQDDAGAFLDACKMKQVPAVLERSRSGNGGHVWIFFSEPVPAVLARRLGSNLLTEAMESNPGMGFGSYDRLFPSQDVMPSGGFGNLIALPLQFGPRRKGNSVFLDGNFEPYKDQWAFLSSIGRLSLVEATRIVEDAERNGQVIGLRLPVDDEDESPWTAPPSRNRPLSEIRESLPERIEAVSGDQIYIPRAGLPPGLVARIIRLAAFQNPSFYSAQAMRRSVSGIPRIISCAELLSHHIALPRGCLDAMEQLFEEAGIKVHLQDERNHGSQVEAVFQGELTAEQNAASNAIVAHETGVLSTATGFGKTVVAASVIAARRTNTLVLVHRRQLMDQWIARLGSFLSLPSASIGRVGGGKRKPSGIVDVGMIQSLVHKGVVDDMVADYGHVVVDECHHVSAVSFETVARRAKARYILGLSATVTRKDGHHPIIFMQCGPVRFRAEARSQARRRPFTHRAILRNTSFRMQTEPDNDPPQIQRIYAELAEDRERNDLIFDDVMSALEQGRSPIVLTERKSHARRLAERLGPFARNVLLLTGGMGIRQDRAIMERIASISEAEERVLVATGRYIGEGFDDARLDTLFLAMPVSWKGTLAQYVGRLHRLHPEKREVRVYDYVDEAVPLLRRMGEKRVLGYRSLGYSVESSNDNSALTGTRGQPPSPDTIF